MMVLKRFSFTPSWILSRKVSSFQRFFEMGREESASPFLDSQAKRISRHMALKSSSASAVFLLVAWVLRFFFSDPVWIIPLCFVYLLSGTPSLIAAVEDLLLRRDVNIDVLTTAAAFGALAIGSPMEGGLLLVLFTLSVALEEVVTLKAKTTLCAIHEIAPAQASIVGEGGFLIERAVEDVNIGETIAVRFGEIVPLDGVVFKGQALISMAHLTGESVPIPVGIGETVSSGARVLDGSIELKVAVTSHDSTVSKLISLITRAHSSKPRLSMAFERYGRAYALTVILTTLFLLFFFPLVLHFPLYGPNGGIVRAMSFLITASPCALILAVPITYLSSLGAAARRGAILKGSMILDRLISCRLVAFDKTGTLTEGKLSVERIIPLTSGVSFGRETVLALAASLERHAVHPIGRAIVDDFSILQQPFFDTRRVQVLPGEGVVGTVVYQGREISLFIGGLGSGFRRVGERGEREKRIAAEEQAKGHAVAMLVIDGREMVLFVLSDSIRPESGEAIRAIKALGRRVILLTGDHAQSAQRVGASLGIDEIFSSLTPERKVELVGELSQKQGVCMVGDGINDAPALSRAAVGISMGQLSSASAREASDIVLLNNSLDTIAWLFEKSSKTRRVVIQNLILAFSAIFLGTITSLQGALPLWAAVAIHEGSTLVVGLNALRLLALR